MMTQELCKKMPKAQNDKTVIAGRRVTQLTTQRNIWAIVNLN